jgi:hypothetical protein
MYCQIVMKSSLEDIVTCSRAIVTQKGDLCQGIFFATSMSIDVCVLRIIAGGRVPLLRNRRAKARLVKHVFARRLC